MEGIVQSGNMPHMIFYGPPGTGKTSTILAAAKQIFGPDFYKKRVLELNASDDRGIPVVREKIKKFAQKAVSKNPNKSYICPVYKVIILDEADLMTTEAQSALRRIIEDNSATTRFCIICNYITKIIEPLSSRCIKFRFNPIGEEAQLKRLQNVCREEGVTTDDKALRTLIQITEGDMRRSINLLQSASLLYDKNIDTDSVLEIAGVVPPGILSRIFEKFREGSLDALLRVVDDILLEGFSPEQILNQYFEGIISSKDYSELKIARILEKISECDKALNEGGKDDLQLYNLFASSLSIISKPDFDTQ